MLGKASGMGCLDSSLQLGRLLLSQCAQGSEVTAESTRGVGLIRMAADAGNVEAMKELAEILTTGKGVERNDSAASRYRMLAGQAEQGASTSPGTVSLVGLCAHRLDASVHAANALIWASQLLGCSRIQKQSALLAFP